MAILTAWWESLFFFGLPVQYIRSVAGWMSDWVIGAFVVLFFLLFHAPLRLLMSGGSPVFLTEMGILALFAIGQFVVYTRTRNLYAVILSHFFWGLVIEIYSRTSM
jgi:membrane protease YdiL (CAAX protease family)